MRSAQRINLKLSFDISNKILSFVEGKSRLDFLVVSSVVLTGAAIINRMDIFDISKIVLRAPNTISSRI